MVVVIVVSPRLLVRAAAIVIVAVEAIEQTAHAALLRSSAFLLVTLEEIEDFVQHVRTPSCGQAVWKHKNPGRIQ